MNVAEVFEFLAKRNYKVKTLKMCKVISQGLLMHPYDFDWVIQADHSIWAPEDGDHGRFDLGDFLKVNPNSEFYTMGANGEPLGAKLG